MNDRIAMKSGPDNSDIELLLTEIIANAERVRAETGYYPHQLRYIERLRSALEDIKKQTDDDPLAIDINDMAREALS